jgi:hypothetical protein
MPLIIASAVPQPMADLLSLTFGAEARRRHDEPDMISGYQCRNFCIAKACGARGLRGHSHKFRKNGLVRVEPGEEFL